MKKKSLIRLVVLALTLSLMAGLVACGGGNETPTTTTTAAPVTTTTAAVTEAPTTAAPAAETTTAAPAPTTTAATEAPTTAATEPPPPAGPVTIKYPSFQVGVNSSAESFARIIAEFDSKYGDRVKIDVEEVPGDQAYIDKMMILLSANDLPDIIYTGGYNMLDMMLEKNAVVDLTPYLDADPDWKSSFDQRTLDFNSRGGRVYGLPDEADLIGYFYNTELFESAGVTPPKTWDEFVEVCDKLLAAGITPVSMDTGDSAWLTNLWLSAILGTTPAGNAFLDVVNPTDYSFPEMVDSLALIQTMFLKYTTRDAVGGQYENGANNFLSGTTAMIANGPWMTEDFDDMTKTDASFHGKVAVALYPGDGVFNAPRYGYHVTSKDKEHADASVEAIKYFTGIEAETISLEMIGRIPASTKMTIPEEVKQSNRLLGDLIAISQISKIQYNYYQAMWYQNVLDAITSYYPDFATGNITPEEMASILTETAGQN
ncbi:MAG: extracellular solute-binding protein [Oscillospiraceae bacterium]|nr:extracellular solute-binding protein [Oscillospiraceae bacterium]